jgi:hypothetical protein
MVNFALVTLFLEFGFVMNFVLKWRGLFIGVLFGWLSSGGLIFAQTNDASEYDVKGAFLCNLAKFVEWPTNTFSSASAPLLIGIYGKNSFTNNLAEFTYGKSIEGHRIVVRKVSINELNQCQVLFIGESKQSKLNTILRKLNDSPVLTVTEEVDPFKSGMMINFTEKDGQIRFEINTHAAKRAGLKISSKLLNLAIKTDVSLGNEKPNEHLCARLP